MEFRLGSEQRVCGPGDVVVIPGGSEHGWFARYRGDRFLCASAATSYSAANPPT